MQGRSRSPAVGAVGLVFLIVALSVGQAVPSDVSVAEEARLLHDEGAGFDRLGAAVDISGTQVIAGAPGHDGQGSFAGAAAVFVRNAHGWHQKGLLTGADTSAGDQFGRSVATDDETAIVGAPFRDDDGPSSGAAYVFSRAAGAWAEQGKLRASDGAAGDEFGRSVDMAGDVAVVGAWRVDGVEADIGAAYVFERMGASWLEVARLDPPAPQNAGWFGYSVATDGDTVVVGSPNARGPTPGAGAAYVYEKEGGAWALSAELRAAVQQVAAFFGGAVDVTDGRIAVGAPFEDTASTNAGVGYVFARMGDEWAQEQRVVPSDTRRDQFAGTSIGIDGATLVLSAHFDDRPAGTASGAAYVYRLVGTGWQQVRKMVAWDIREGDRYGAAVAASGDLVVASAPDHDEGPTTSVGAVYVIGLDRDFDELTDWAEAHVHGTDPDRQDSDGDRLKDGHEVYVYWTDPLDDDTDGDLFNDRREVQGRSDPNNPFSVPGPLGPVTLHKDPPIRENPLLDPVRGLP